MPQLTDLFGIAWEAAAAADVGVQGNQQAGAVAATRPPAAAVRFLVHLVKAHSELRQLDTLFKGMYRSLLLLPEAGSSSHKHHTAAAAAAHVLSSDPFVKAVTTAVLYAPSGQAAALVNCVNSCLSLLLPLQQQQQQYVAAVLPLLGDPLAAVLDSIPVDLTTAPGVAAAAQHMLQQQDFWQPLPAVAAAAAGNADQMPATMLLLRVYMSLVR